MKIIEGLSHITEVIFNIKTHRGKIQKFIREQQ